MALKKSEKLMMAGVGVAVVVFVIMDPYYIIYKTAPEDPALIAAREAKAKKAAAAGTTEAGKAKPDAKAPVKGKASGKGKKAEEEPPPPEPEKPKRDPIKFANWGRDPFIQMRRNLDDEQALSNLKLSGLSIRGSDRYAIINSQILRVGDTVEGMTITKIEQDKVTLHRNGDTYSLRWGSR
jgi:hypothetical protein